eukprot:CAMPEP_0117651062 /NCGR_PEP_ID=MMETSP0804-20121206/1890_1 /TAXON_ID=1074897 /ORGANISM="Tetraselmis astigmatica, Strain CCMP880" /LENGTH=137 /DNA_ID=CAMNT_0005457011 /DNA_START=585 /DNA_END=998 /DNA_ORIENTATION=+
MAASGSDGAAEALRAQSCVGMCGRDTPLLSDADIDEKVKALPLWILSSDRKMLSRMFVAKSFVAALKFFNDVGEVAEQEGHHPDLHLTGYRNVQVDITTHAVGNALTLPDFILAAKLDAIKVEYSPKWMRENLPLAE